MEIVCNTILSNQSESTNKAYNRVKESYVKFRGDAANNEETVLKWVTNEAKTKAPTTLWSEVSLLLKYLHLEEKTEINRTAINLFIKTLSSTHKKKQAPAFSKEELMTYLIRTPNEPENLTDKLYVLFCYFGALRYIRSRRPKILRYQSY